MSFLSYIFDPVPPNPDYVSPQMLPFLLLSLVLIAGTFVLSRWRKKTSNVITKKLSKSWPTASFVFGFTGLILVISRVESIQYFSMRFWWVLWLILGVLYIGLQHRLFRARHYQVMPHERVTDPREKYLPKRKRG